MSVASMTAVPTRVPTSPPAPVRAVVSTQAQRRARPRTTYAVASVLGIFVILLTQLMVSIALSDGAYRISALESQRVDLDRSQQVLTESLDALRSPQFLAVNAESLGMVANTSPAYLRVADATVLGAPVAARAGAGVLNGRGTMIGNVLLADVALVAAAATEGVSAVRMAPRLSPPGSTPPPAGTIPSPVTR